MKSLNNKVVLITGASSGIGRACAEKFAEEGARLILAARRKERLIELARKLNTPVHIIELDVTNRQAVETALKNLPADFAAIDVLINNAGLGRGLDKLQEGNPDGWNEMIDTNIKGLLYVSRAVLPGMVNRGSGQVINIGSIAGHEVYPGGNVYCATKHAVGAITRGMRIDLVDSPIRVATIDPGLVETEFSEVRFDGDKDRAGSVYKGYQPLSGADIAETAVWIASRPPHVQIAEVIIFPTAQRSAMIVHKE
ncbi:MAG TPA: SDR family NAD(P)-dependent oxidoreductase [candidate division Zixibacteria bacterium]|nr:SDR family NAD(P)-dependent oxidoreductase [candidate division Zixibacteria bacterium]